LEFIILFIIFWGVYRVLRTVYRANLVKNGKADYFVKVAASGKGSVYHKMSCGKCTSWYEMAEKEAQRRGYPPCATCGGYGTFKLIRK